MAGLPAVKRFAALEWHGVDHRRQSTGVDLSSVAIVAPNDGWATGDDGTILRWNGTNWTTFASPTSNWLFSTAMVSASDGWIVGGRDTGQQSSILHWDGSAWQSAGINYRAPERSEALIGRRRLGRRKQRCDCALRPHLPDVFAGYVLQYALRPAEKIIE
jgi:photosystem II stability/assembly factor-like uncharacterized protein